VRKLGIIGGASWNSTALYYDQINRGVAQRLGGLHSARLIIESLDFEDDYARFHRVEDWAGAEKVIVAAAERLKGAGCDGLLLGSNTMHKHFDAVAASTGLPLLHIGDSAAERLSADGVRSAALLGTRFTMAEPFVRDRFERRGIQLTQLDPAWAQEVDRIIYEELAAGRVVRDSQRKLKTLITELGQKKKARAIILGCTELVMAVDTRANVLPVYDTTALHARAAVDWMLAPAEEQRAAA
jgi:aspartate racemase